MSDDTPIDDTTGGLDRRSLIKRGAVVGGALVWTTPLVQAIASPAFGATESDPGGGGQGGGCPAGQVATAITSDKFNFGNFTGTPVVGTRDGGPLATGTLGGNNQCFAEAGAPAGTTRSAPGAIVSAVKTGNFSVVVTLQPGLTLLDAGVKAANDCFDAIITAGPANSYTVTFLNGQNAISNIIFKIGQCVPAPVAP